jgi:hypothetical protein
MGRAFAPGRPFFWRVNHVDDSKRAFLRAAGLLVAEAFLSRTSLARSASSGSRPKNKVVLAVIGGVRRQETFSLQGFQNIPHLAQELGPESLFYTDVRNEGVTAHFNAISSILTGTWQRVGDWGENSPTAPTVFEYFRKQLDLPPSEAWIVASNKALTDLIGASSVRSYGPAFGANVVLPKQLMINTVVNAIWSRKNSELGDPQKIQAQMEEMLQGTNYEGLGWNVFDAANRLDPHVRATIVKAVASLLSGSGPMTGDRLTFFMAREIMRKFAPPLMMVNFSDVEAAHFGSYSMHLMGLHNVDEICAQLWQEVKTNPEYAGKTTLIILPEFGRDADGSSTNGFFNHRAFDDSCRSTWMMVLGAYAGSPRIVKRQVHQVDICPTVAGLLGFKAPDTQGVQLDELKS